MTSDYARSRHPHHRSFGCKLRSGCASASFFACRRREFGCDKSSRLLPAETAATVSAFSTSVALMGLSAASTDGNDPARFRATPKIPNCACSPRTRARRYSSLLPTCCLTVWPPAASSSIRSTGRPVRPSGPLIGISSGSSSKPASPPPPPVQRPPPGCPAGTRNCAGLKPALRESAMSRSSATWTRRAATSHRRSRSRHVMSGSPSSLWIVGSVLEALPSLRGMPRPIAGAGLLCPGG